MFERFRQPVCSNCGSKNVSIVMRFDAMDVQVPVRKGHAVIDASQRRNPKPARKWLECDVCHCVVNGVELVKV